jgi:hypothetical protein
LLEVDDVLERKVPGAAEKLWKLTGGDPPSTPLPQCSPNIPPSRSANRAQHPGVRLGAVCECGEADRRHLGIEDFWKYANFYLLACAFGPLTIEDVDILPASLSTPPRCAALAESRPATENDRLHLQSSRIGQYLAEELMTKAGRTR